MKQEDIKIITDGKKEIVFSVEIPETEEEFCTGLAYRKSVPEKNGMLYYLERENPDMYMFTPETEIPVDFIFLDICGNILKISRNAKPLSMEKHFCKKARAVLEINGGESDKYNIKEGDVLFYDKLYPSKNYAELTVTNAEEYFSLGRNLYAYKNGSLYSYSFKCHAWFSKDVLIDEVKYSQEINNFKKNLLTEEQVKTLLHEYENDFRIDYYKNLKKYYVLKKDLLLSHNEIDNIYEIYIYGLGWKRIERFFEYTFSYFKWYSNRITYSEAENMISLNEKRSKEINDKANDENLSMVYERKPSTKDTYSYSVIFGATVYKYNFSILKCFTWKYGNEEDNWSGLIFDMNNALFYKCMQNEQISEQKAFEIINKYEQRCKEDGKQANIHFYDYKK